MYGTLLGLPMYHAEYVPAANFEASIPIQELRYDVTKRAHYDTALKFDS